MATVSDRVAFTCNGAMVEVDPGRSLLDALRDELRLTSVKDGCAPQGQCGCCTVLVDGSPRVACVTPVARVAGRSVTTVEGLDEAIRDRLAAAFCDTGGSQCGFCTPGILIRGAALLELGKADDAAALDRALAGHLCRCTGWSTIVDALRSAGSGVEGGLLHRDLEAASVRAELEGGSPQRVALDIALGSGGFADDTAPRDALVAVLAAPSTSAPTEPAAGCEWVIADSPLAARERAGKVQGRRTTVPPEPPLPIPRVSEGGVCLATSYVEPAYLEPDASWCAPGGEPASPLANGGAFGGKETSVAPAAARELADRHGCPVRVLFSREDVVRLGPKRPPMAASAAYEAAGRRLVIQGSVVGSSTDAFDRARSVIPYAMAVEADWRPVIVPGPPVADRLRAVGDAETAVLVEGALSAAGLDRNDRLELLSDDRARAVLLDTVVEERGGALAGASVEVDDASIPTAVRVCVAAGDPLDDVVLRSYATGAAHMALGWVLSEGLAVEAETGEVLDLTIRSFGILRARETPSIEVEIADDPGPPRARSSDAVFCAVAAATWNALAAHGARPASFPAR